ncbi:hypothetical protein ACFX11_037637 [Malus domestica]
MQVRNQAKNGMVLPFEPLSLAFNHMNYHVDMPPSGLVSIESNIFEREFSHFVIQNKIQMNKQQQWANHKVSQWSHLIVKQGIKKPSKAPLPLSRKISTRPHFPATPGIWKEG